MDYYYLFFIALHTSRRTFVIPTYESLENRRQLT